MAGIGLKDTVYLVMTDTKTNKSKPVTGIVEYIGFDASGICVGVAVNENTTYYVDKREVYSSKENAEKEAKYRNLCKAIIGGASRC